LVAWRQHEIIRFDGNSETVLGYIRHRCGAPNTLDGIRIPSSNEDAGDITFDAVNGHLYVPLISTCAQGSSGSCSYTERSWMARIEGFTTIFEILQTYTSTSNTLSFRAPYMPEGFAAADWFDTYWGDLATVGNWSHAQPLQCGYPASEPSVGDYLTVADTLPAPAPGHGYYYVTAVNYLGERRYGRKRINGVMSGRDPAGLPGCSQ
jgi:hypothetical protein